VIKEVGLEKLISSKQLVEKGVWTVSKADQTFRMQEYTNNEVLNEERLILISSESW